VDRSDFATFFTAVRPGQQPFAWQERLLDALLQDGRWPDRIVAPTGAGKTAVVDVHVFANALAALGQGPRLPRRLAMVVDRRVVVDSHDEHARDIADLLAQCDGDVLGEVSRALRSLRLDLASTGVDPALEHEAPLLTVRMRGGAPAPRAWRDHPEACAVLTATPDMLGSRLLLQGYASSRRAWPREAGLLALDTVLVVDEAHLSRQFLFTARRVSALAPTGALTGSVPLLQVVETTATPEAGSGTEVGVEPMDVESDEVLRRRMITSKPVQLLPLPTWPLAPNGAGVPLLSQQVRLAREELGPTVGAVVNRVSTAVELARQLDAAGLVVELLVGRMRPADVAHLRRRRPGLLDITGNADVDVLVATQTVEVGLDLDLSALITELAPGAALAQRSGRVNRRGDRASTRVVIAVPPGSTTVPDKGAQPYSGRDLTDGLVWVTSRAASPDGLAPWSLRLNPPPGQALRRTLLRRLELTDSWAWAATGDLPFARPDLALWLADDLSADRDCWLVVRDDLPSEPLRAVELLRLLPPRPHELFCLPLYELQNLLPGWFAAPADGPPPPPVLRWRDADVEVLGVTDSVRAGDVVVLDASRPIQVRGVVLDNPAREPAVDVLQALTGRESRPNRGRVALRWGTTHDGQPARGLLPRAVRELLAEGPAGQRGDWSRDQRQALGKALALADVDGSTAELLADRTIQRDAAAALLQQGRIKDSALTVLSDGQGEPAILVVRDLRRVVADEDVRQTWTPADQPVPLQQHAAAVASAAAQLAARLGLGEDTANLLRLAGLHHDDGKADPRFQRVLGRTDDDPLLAKSALRRAVDDAADRSGAGLPMGWRHEQLSALLAWRAVEPAVRELVARLAGTTHGHGRHGFAHGAASLLGLPTQDVPADAEALFDDGEWEQLMQDTDEQHGVWAMAYLEAVLRAADGRVSAAGS